MTQAPIPLFRIEFEQVGCVDLIIYDAIGNIGIEAISPFVAVTDGLGGPGLFFLPLGLSPGVVPATGFHPKSDGAGAWPLEQHGVEVTSHLDGASQNWTPFWSGAEKIGGIKNASTVVPDAQADASDYSPIFVPNSIQDLNGLGSQLVEAGHSSIALRCDNNWLVPNPQLLQFADFEVGESLMSKKGRYGSAWHFSDVTQAYKRPGAFPGPFITAAGSVTGLAQFFIAFRVIRVCNLGALPFELTPNDDLVPFEPLKSFSGIPRKVSLEVSGILK